jgi:hypothetical protein
MRFGRERSEKKIQRLCRLPDKTGAAEAA